jgi:hypothetical protein
MIVLDPAPIDSVAPPISAPVQPIRVASSKPVQSAAAHQAAKVQREALISAYIQENADLVEDIPQSMVADFYPEESSLEVLAPPSSLTQGSSTTSMSIRVDRHVFNENVRNYKKVMNLLQAFIHKFKTCCCICWLENANGNIDHAYGKKSCPKWDERYLTYATGLFFSSKARTCYVCCVPTILPLHQRDSCKWADGPGLLMDRVKPLLWKCWENEELRELMSADIVEIEGFSDAQYKNWLGEPHPTLRQLHNYVVIYTWLADAKHLVSE